MVVFMVCEEFSFSLSRKDALKQIFLLKAFLEMYMDIPFSDAFIILNLLITTSIKLVRPVMAYQSRMWSKKMTDVISKCDSRVIFGT